MKRIKIPWDKFEEPHLGIPLIVLAISAFLAGLVVNPWIMIVFPLVASWVIWNELGEE